MLLWVMMMKQPKEEASTGQAAVTPVQRVMQVRWLMLEAGIKGKQQNGQVVRQRRESQ